MIPLAIVVCCLAGAGAIADAAALADPAFPTVQAVPLPHHEIAFEIGGIEVARHYGGDNTPKPFIFPLIGPSGRRLTTMAHPIDPHGHRHHRSVWVGHRDVNGHNFWEETDGNRIVMTRLDAYGHTGNTGWFRAAHEWRDAQGAVVLNEERTWTMVNLEEGAFYLDLQMRFSHASAPVTFGQTPYGPLGVRVVPTMSVSAGGGRILNAEGHLNEAGVHGNAARWVDYSGPVAPGVVNGIAYFDHPENPGFPATFLVRDEGWMCASLTSGAPYTVTPDTPLVVRYRLYVHGPAAEAEVLDAHWNRFAAPAR